MVSYLDKSVGLVIDEYISLNPYCSGQWSRTAFTYFFVVFVCVLILIVVDNGLVLDLTRHY